jgi:hypothetical protein
MGYGFPNPISQPVEFAYQNIFYPYSQRITVRLDNRSVSVQKAELFLPPSPVTINTVTAGQILKNPDGSLSVLTAGLFSSTATVYVPTAGLLILDDGRITTTTPGLLMHPAGYNLVPTAGLLLHADGTITIPPPETPSSSTDVAPDGTSDLFLHPDGTNYYAVQFYVGATVSSFSHMLSDDTTANLTIRATTGANDVLYSVDTINRSHTGYPTNLAISYYSDHFTFIISETGDNVRALCRKSLPAKSVNLVGEIKLKIVNGPTFTSNSFPITCFTPVIRSEQF